MGAAPAAPAALRQAILPSPLGNQTTANNTSLGGFVVGSTDQFSFRLSVLTRSFFLGGDKNMSGAATQQPRRTPNKRPTRVADKKDKRVNAWSTPLQASVTKPEDGLATNIPSNGTANGALNSLNANAGPGPSSNSKGSARRPSQETGAAVNSGTTGSSVGNSSNAKGNGTTNTSAHGAAVTGGGNGNGSPAQHMHDRLLFLLSRSIGKTAIVTVASGQRFKGVLSGAASSSDLGVVLAAATNIEAVPGMEESDSSGPLKLNANGKLVIQAKDCVDIFIEKVNLSGPQVAPKGFRTDSDIGAGVGAQGGKQRTGTPTRERELERWSPGADMSGSNPALENLGALEDERPGFGAGNRGGAGLGSGSASFDQFHANKQRFGISSTYDEHLYTTVIDKSHPEYKQREQRAERIAAEINASGYQGNVHIAEERGLVVDDSGADEEDKYSGVVRGQAKEKEKENVYKQASAQPKLAERLDKHTLRDPAIISSSLAKSSTGMPGASTGGSASANASVAGSPATAQNQKYDGGNKQEASTIETELVGNFRQFVNNEAERVKMHKSQYWQHREKNERLHDFKKFSEDFKIKTPVPPDLVPILTKSRPKQAETSPTAPSKQTEPPAATSSPATDAAKPKPKFNFSASFTPKFTPGSAAPPAAGNIFSPQVPAAPGLAVPPPGASPAFSPSAGMASPVPMPAPNQMPLPPAPGLSPSPHGPAKLHGSPQMNQSAPITQNQPPSHPHTPLTSSSSSASPARRLSQSPANEFFPPGRQPSVSSKSKKNWKDAFNPFITFKKQEKPIEAAYATAPTWTVAVDQSYTQVVASIAQKAPRGNVNGSAAAGAAALQPMMGGMPFPAGVGIPPQMLNLMNMQMGMGMNMNMNMSMDMAALQAMQNMQNMQGINMNMQAMQMGPMPGGMGPIPNLQALQAMGGAPLMMPGVGNMYGGAVAGMRPHQPFSPSPSSGANSPQGGTPVQQHGMNVSGPGGRPNSQPLAQPGPRPVVMSPQPSDGQYYSPATGTSETK